MTNTQGFTKAQHKQGLKESRKKGIRWLAKHGNITRHTIISFAIEMHSLSQS